MKTNRFSVLYTVLVMALSLSACSPATPTPEPQTDIVISNIIENDEIVGQIEQTRLFNQCENTSPLKTQIQFSQSVTETTSKELVVSAGVTGGADIPEIAKIELEAAVEEHFAAEKARNQSRQETVDIEVPGKTQLEYKIIWNEIRRRGTIEYLENGVSKFANYSYRIGIELASSSARDVGCLFTVTPSPTVEPPTETPSPEPAAATPEPPVWVEKPINEGCIFAKTWQVDSTDAEASASVSIDENGCYSLSTLGLAANRSGTLRLLESDKKYSVTSGIYTPVTETSTIEFEVYVNYLYIVYPDTPAFITFAVAPANDPITDKAAARFKVLVDKNDKKPTLYFVMADAGEFSGSKIKSQHYEYSRKYNIRLELSGVVMIVYVNNVRMDEDLTLPDGPKVFYIGYSLPIVGGVDAEITNIKIDGAYK